MWPFSAIKRARYQRRYQAAWTLLLARYTFSKLTPIQQETVRARDSQYLVACGGSAYISLRRRIPNRYFSDYTFAMKSLGIPPALANARWPIPDDIDMQQVIPNRWGLLPRGHARLMRYWFKLIANYRVFDVATQDAQRDLAKQGIDIAIIDPVGPNDIHHVGPDGAPVTWREYARTLGTAASPGRDG